MGIMEFMEFIHGVKDSLVGEVLAWLSLISLPTRMFTK